MGFSLENGYIPVSIPTIMNSIMLNINEQFGTTYTTETFAGTNFYKYFYALAQRMQDNEVKTSEIFLKLQQYFAITNERISRPVVTNPGLEAKFLVEGWKASIKPMIDADAGKIHIAVDVDEEDPLYADWKLEINSIIKNSTVAGTVTQGTEISSFVFSNGQVFDYKFNLPDRIATKLKLTITLSENNMSSVGDPDEIKEKLIANIKARYRLGMNFEPQKYFSLADAPWASQVKLEWSIDDGVSYTSDVFEAEYDELLDVKLIDTTLIED